MELLNEHSRDEDVRELADFCSKERVALVTDCGTPGFCDPGARLVALCRQRGIKVRSLPGASALMVLLSMSGSNLREFVFRGFLPAEREERGRALAELDREKRPIVLMDTPYRLDRLVSELAQKWPKRRALLGLDFTLPTEQVWEDELSALASRVKDRKAEFMLVVYPK
jgi:16S rRNA (cytidine1402-2'-O)-methyltransferase